MTILGKVLLFFNILAGGAVAYFATQSWTARQTENATALRYYLFLQGFPFESGPFPPPPEDPKQIDEAYIPLGTEKEPFRMGPSQTVNSVRLGFLKDHFKNADKGVFSSTTPPNSRLGEFKRVRGVVESYVESTLKTDADRLTWLVGKYTGLRFDPGVLVQLADSYEEREAYRSLVRRPSDKDEHSAERVEMNAKLARVALKGKLDAISDAPNAGALTGETTELHKKSEAVAAAAETAKTAGEKLKAATEAYRKVYEPLLKNSVETNFTADAAAKESLADARKAQDLAYAALVKALDDKRDAEIVLLTMQAAARPVATDEADRLRRMVQFLMVLDKGDSWQRRLVLVFGMPDYIAALRDRLERYVGARPYAVRLRETMDAETAEFNSFYERSKEVAIDRDRQLYRQTEITDSLKKQLEKSKAALAQALTQKAENAADLAAVTAEVAKRLEEQGRYEAELFDVQKQVGKFLHDNFELEAKLETAERGLAGRP